MKIGRKRAPRRAAVGVVTAALAAGAFVVPAPAVAAAALAVTPTATARVAPNTTQTLSGLSVSGDTTDTLQATIATDVGTLTLPVNNGLELSYNNHWSGDAAITFTGSQANINTALHAAQLVAGNNTGKTAHVSLNALVAQSGYVYLAPNQHFYQYVAAANINWNTANTAAQALTFMGQQGYLATIPNDTVNNFVSSKIQGATNVWFGAQSIDTPTSSPARTWQWVGGPLAGQPISYCTNFLNTCNFANNAGLYSHWASGEPNNANGVAGTAHSGEWNAVTNWGGDVGHWNDLAPTATGIAGYVVEYGNLAVGSTGFTGLVSTSSGVLIADVPKAPTAVTAVRGEQSATVWFTAPADNGSPITGYTVTAYQGGNSVLTAPCAASPCTVGGLTDGIPYTFTVHATNAIGDSPESAGSAAVTPATVPGAPTDVSAVRGDRSATVSFSEPDSDGGSAIVNYTVTAHPGGATDVCAGSPCIIDGLINGASFTFTVHATNDVGDSVESSPSAPVTPATVAQAPTNVSAVRGDSSATVSFDAPAGDVGSAITGYVVTAEPGHITADCSASPCTIGGLDNGTLYTLSVTAINGVGVGADSGTTTVTPAAAPGSPAWIRLERGDRSAVVSFPVPADNGAPITGYQVSIDDGNSWQPLDTTGTDPVTGTVTGLTNGVITDVEVRAVNDVGPGRGVAAGVVAATHPDAPANVTAARAGAGTVSVSFAAPADDGGYPITGYTLTAYSDGNPVATVNCAASPCTVTDLTDGQQYTFTVHARNGVGAGPESDPSQAVVPATVPDAPEHLTVTSGNGALALSFDAPPDNGGDAIAGYQATVDGGQTWIPLTVSGDGPLTATLTGLYNGVTYHVSVRATNTVGASDPAGPQDAKPASVPGAPRSVRASETGTTAVISWTAPADNGGAKIVRYTVTASPGGARCITTGTSCTIAGMPTGKTYTFAVTADNSTRGLPGTGVGPAGTSAPTMISGLPGAPKVSGTPRDRSLQVHLTPGSSGGTPVTSYRVTLDGPGTHQVVTVKPGSHSVTFTGLLNGASYRVAVNAVNAHGAGPAGAATVRLKAWFRDPVAKTARRDEVPVPARINYWGKPKHTTATARSHNGTPAIAASRLHGRQLQNGQAAQLSTFRFDSATLTRTGRAQVAAITHSLRYVHSLTCEGYTDYGGEARHEMTLSQRRADAVCHQLARDGVRVGKTVRAYGSHRPVVIGGRPADRAANRRVIVVVNS